MMMLYRLMPTGSGKGVMAVCDRRPDGVSILVVNSLIEPPTLKDMMLMAIEHEREHHGGQ